MFEKLIFFIGFSEGCERAFENIDDDIDYVINLAAETRKGQSEPVYKDGILKLTSNLCEFVNKKFGNRLKCYMEFSTGALYNSEKVSRTKYQFVSAVDKEKHIF